MNSLRYRFQTVEFGDLDIHVRTLRDTNQFQDDDGIAAEYGISSATWPLFGVLWESSRPLAELMLDYDIEGKRILEVGCGIALASLVLSHRNADIVATDYHPEAGRFLEYNAALNGDKKIPFFRTGWAEMQPELGLFDVIIGSEVLYERGHALDLSDFISRHAKPAATVIIVDPGREHRSRFSQHMVKHGFSHERTRPETRKDLPETYHGQILEFVRDPENPIVPA